jgi:hypothetical protein
MEDRDRLPSEEGIIPKARESSGYSKLFSGFVFRH